LAEVLTIWVLASCSYIGFFAAI